MSGAAFFGLTLISGSKLVFALAVIRHLSQWWFLSKVEKYVLNRWEPSGASYSLRAYAARTCASCMATR